MRKRQSAKNKIPKPRKNMLLEFACMALYYTITATVLSVFTSIYLRMELMNCTILDNPIVFALGIFGCGIVSWFFYQVFNFFISVVLGVLTKRKHGSLYALRSAEATLISILICITLGAIVYFTQSDNPQAILVYQMLFSLPIGKLTFLDSSPRRLVSDIRELITESKGACLFVIYLIIESVIFLLPKVPALLCNLLLILIALVLIVRSILSSGRTPKSKATT